MIERINPLISLLNNLAYIKVLKQFYVKIE